MSNDTAAASRDTLRSHSVFDFVFTHDLDGRIVSVNPAVCAALGRTAEVLRGMTIPEFLPPYRVAQFAPQIARVKGNGTAQGMVSVIGGDGRLHIWEWRAALIAEDLVRTEARDVTEKEEALRALRRHDEHYRSIIENVSDIIAIVELDGRLRYGSPSVTRLLGYEHAEIRRTEGMKLVHPDDRVAGLSFLDRQTANPAANQRIELRLRHRDGTWLSFEIVATNLLKEGKVSAVIINARDITERKQLQLQLLQANRLAGLGRLAAIVAHDFNNVLMGMQMFAELMQRPNAKPEIMAKGAGHIANSIQRGKRIVLDIFRFTQPQVPVRVPIDLGKWWEGFEADAVDVLGNSVRLTATIPVGLSVLADRVQLSQAVLNIVTNSREAMPIGGSLTVTAQEPAADARFSFGSPLHPERFIQLSIRDSGHGIPAAQLDRIFEPLFTTRFGSRGLGLAVAHQVLTQNHGFLFAESDGDGSTLHLFLPRAESSAPGIPRRETTHPLSSRRVLIVDDEVSIAEGMVALLQDEGFETEVVATGGEALQAVERFQPDIVVLDLRLPDMDGSEVYDRVRVSHPTLPIIVATGHGDRSLIPASIDDARSRFLQKPFDVAALLAAIAEIAQQDVPFLDRRKV